MWKRIITLTVLFCMALSLSVPALAANRYSMDKQEKESALPYTFGDLAAARLAVYCFLDERFRTPQPETAEPLSRLEAVQLLWSAFAEEAAPKDTTDKSGKNGGKNIVVLYSRDSAIENSAVTAFPDVPVEYVDQVAWAIAQGLTDTEFGVCNASETAFVTMLLNAMGYQGKFEYACALHFAESIGLAPLGLSRYFTLGDAALYLQAAMDLKTADGISLRDRINIPAKLEQTTFPDSMILTPLNPEDADAQIREATRYLADVITVRGDYLTKDDLYGIYRQYFHAEGEQWYISRTYNDYDVYPEMDTIDCTSLPEDGYEAYTAITKTLWERYQAETLSAQDYFDTYELEKAKHLCSGKSVTLSTRYNEAWELAFDLDDAFTLYVDDRITNQADAFYQRHFAMAETDKEKVYAAKNAINLKAEYAPVAGYDDWGAYYAPDAHSILGFFDKNRIVCDGYASVFQYLMIRSGVECVMVLGSTVSKQAAEEYRTDHAWNKVKVDGVWYNMDVCWSDTGWPYTFDLKSDEFYAANRHWAVTYSYL